MSIIAYQNLHELSSYLPISPHINNPASTLFNNNQSLPASEPQTVFTEPLRKYLLRHGSGSSGHTTHAINTCFSTKLGVNLHLHLHVTPTKRTRRNLSPSFFQPLRRLPSVWRSKIYRWYRLRHLFAGTFLSCQWFYVVEPFQVEQARKLGCRLPQRKQSSGSRSSFSELFLDTSASSNVFLSGIGNPVFSATLATSFSSTSEHNNQ